MNLVVICNIIYVLLLIGCSKPNVIYKTDYKKVNIPVMASIEKPNRPVYTKEDNTITYLNKVLEYTEILETIIETYNKQGK